MGQAAGPNFRNFRAGPVISRVRRPERDTCVARGTASCGRERRARRLASHSPIFRAFDLVLRRPLPASLFRRSSLWYSRLARRVSHTVLVRVSL